MHRVDLGAHQTVQVLFAGHQRGGQRLVQERTRVLRAAHVLRETHQDVHHTAENRDQAAVEMCGEIIYISL